jgi:hypothetical protein
MTDKITQLREMMAKETYILDGPSPKLAAAALRLMPALLDAVDSLRVLRSTHREVFDFATRAVYEGAQINADRALAKLNDIQ